CDLFPWVSLSPCSFPRPLPPRSRNHARTRAWTAQMRRATLARGVSRFRARGRSACRGAIGTKTPATRRSTRSPTGAASRTA
ncbi:MAG: hypothetical protein AVDCRST_MAG90-2837, partial [uncultured Microvirga sp.]